jgi:alkyl hydroperoxide reductase subunit AhpC
MEEVLDVGDEIPNFNLDSQLGMISFREIIDGRWCLLFTFRQAFDPVATTDIAMVCKMFDEFEARNIIPIAMGCDSVSNYRMWIGDIEDIQSTKVKVPLLSDVGCKALAKFGCAKLSAASNELVPVSIGCFLIDIDKRIRTCMRYSPLTGKTKTSIHSAWTRDI